MLVPCCHGDVVSSVSMVIKRRGEAMATGVRETDTGYKRRAKQIVEARECQNFNLEWERKETGVC